MNKNKDELLREFTSGMISMVEQIDEGELSKADGLRKQLLTLSKAAVEEGYGTLPEGDRELIDLAVANGAVVFGMREEAFIVMARMLTSIATDAYWTGLARGVHDMCEKYKREG